MRTTPREDPATVSAADAAADPAAAAATMRSEGLLKVKGLVPLPEATAALVAHIEARLAEGRAVCKEDPVKEYQYFGGVLVRNNRYDLKLELEPPQRYRRRKKRVQLERLEKRAFDSLAASAESRPAAS